MKKSLITYRSEWYRFREYVWKARWWILLFNCLLLFVYNFWLVPPELHIDPDEYIMSQGTHWGGGDVGRQGKTLVHILFRMERFNPAFEVAFGWIAICLSTILMGYVLYRFGQKRAVFCAACGTLVYISPIVAEQFCFYERLFSHGIGYSLCAVSVGLSYFGIIKKRIGCVTLSLLCMMWAFSIYQTFVLVYVALSIICFCLLYRRWAISEGREDVRYFPIILKQVLVFAAAYIINTVITNVFFFSDSGFNDMVIYWGSQPIRENILNIGRYIIKCFTGTAYYTTWIYGLLCICTVLGVTAECVHARRPAGGVLYVLAVIALQMLPFLMAVYQGGEPPVHGQFIYPVVMAGDIAILSGLMLGRIKRALAFVTAVIVTVLFWSQGQVVMRQLYTDRVRIEEDKQVAAEVATRLHALEGEEKPVLFIGTYANRLNPACIRGDYIGITVFGWDRGSMPHYVPGSIRTAQFLNTLGMGFRGVTDESIGVAARKKALDMPSWPAAGSVADAGDCVIVKLSEDAWPEEVMEPSARKVGKLDMTEGAGVSVVIDSVDESGEDLVIKGWIDQTDDKKQTWKPHVYLFTDDGGMYEIATVKTGRDSLWLDGERCINSGFTAMAERASLPGELSDYSVVFVYEDTATGARSLCLPAVTADTSLDGQKAGLPEGGETEKIDLPTYNGYQYGVPVSLDGDGGVISDGSAGAVIYGPYSQSDDGVYDVTVNYSVLSYTDQSEGVVDVVLDAQACAQGSFTAEDTSVTLEDVEMEPGHALETRVWVPEGMVIQIHSIEYERVN